MKVILGKLNQEFQGGIEFNTSVPTDEKEGNGPNVKIDAYSHDHLHEPSQSKQSLRKTLTVGSLKQR